MMQKDGKLGFNRVSLREALFFMDVRMGCWMFSWAHGSKGVLVGSLPAFCSKKTNGPLTRNAIFLFAFLRYATFLRQYRRRQPHS